MTISEKVQALLIADSTLTALVPAARIKTPGKLQGIVKPYTVHFCVDGAPTNVYTGRMNLTEWAYQISVFGSTYGEAEAAAVAARDALVGEHEDAKASLTRGPYYADYEADTDTHHFVVELSIASQL